ncbi:MAG: hypothetical protein ABR538_00590 [Candidatus Binatia bacterium]
MTTPIISTLSTPPTASAPCTVGISRAVVYRLGLLALAPALATLLLASPAAAQPVCGDVTDDQLITTTDALRVLRAAVGQPVELVCGDQCTDLELAVADLQTRMAALELLLAKVSIAGNNLVVTGMNLQVVSGSGSTSGKVNGTGNVIIGYDEADDNQDKKSGSHNLVAGRNHSYESYGGIVAGEDNILTGGAVSVLGGERNRADADLSVVVGGRQNEADGESSVVVAGENNRTVGRSCVVTSGAQNLCSGLVSAVGGGSANFCSGQGSVIGGGSNRTLGSNLGWMAGSLGPVF